MSSLSLSRLPFRTLVLATALPLLTAFAADKPAAKYQPGDAVEAFTTKDQHGKDYAFTPDVKTIVVAFAMSTGKDTNRYLEKQPATFLSEHRAIFVANIHGMPGIGRKFALPKMRKYPHRILLADAEHFLDRYPKKEDMLTVLRLDSAGKVTAIDYVDPEKDCAKAFAPAP